MPDHQSARSFVLTLLVLTLFLPSACDSSDLTTLEPVTTTTREQILTPAPSPAQSPTPRPTALPTQAHEPLPTPVFIPREELPDGRLFTDDLYALLKGEGATYHVFDSFGQLSYTFTYIDTDGYINSPVGLYTEDELWERGYIDTAPLGDPEIRAYGSGFYRISGQDDQVTVDLYDRTGKHILSLNESAFSWEVLVSAYGNGTAVCFSPDQKKSILFLISPTGQIRKKIQADTSYFALLAEKYLCYNLEESGELFDFNNRVIAQDVVPIMDRYLTMHRTEAIWIIAIGKYYQIAEQVFEARTLEPVPAGTIDPDLGLIRGLSYRVEGIECVANYFDNRFDTVAVGYAQDRIAIRTKDASYSFDAGTDRFYAINKSMIVLADEQNQHFRILLLATGKQVTQIKGFHHIQLADDYIIVSSNNMISGEPGGFFIIDRDGNPRYASAKSRALITHGNYIILQRGPYIGIADLNGDWLIKALEWETMRDADFWQTAG